MPYVSPYKPSPWTEPRHLELRDAAVEILRRDKIAHPNQSPSGLMCEAEWELEDRFPEFKNTAAMHDLVCDAGEVVWPEWYPGMRSQRSYDTYEEEKEAERRWKKAEREERFQQLQGKTLR